MSYSLHVGYMSICVISCHIILHFIVFDVDVL